MGRRERRDRNKPSPSGRYAAGKINAREYAKELRTFMPRQLKEVQERVAKGARSEASVLAEAIGVFSKKKKALADVIGQFSKKKLARPRT